jgi:hypothetical protein
MFLGIMGRNRHFFWNHHFFVVNNPNFCWLKLKNPFVNGITLRRQRHLAASCLGPQVAPAALHRTLLLVTPGECPGDAERKKIGEISKLMEFLDSIVYI